MFDKTNRLESQSSRKRYLVGKRIEESIIACLTEKYGFKIETAELKVDRDEKIDCFIIENETKKACQVKTRMGYSGKDLLVDVFEPFFGLDNPNTKIGRDHAGNYDYYVVLINDKLQDWCEPVPYEIHQ